MTRMKLMSVIGSAELGGAEKHLEFIVANMEAEHIVVALADGPMAERYRAAGAEVIIVPAPGKMPLKAVSPFRNVVRRFEPDVLHTHTPKANLLGAISGVRKIRVMTVHGSHRQFASSRMIPAAWYRWADLWAAKKANRVIAVCESDRRELIEAGFSAARTVVVRNGVPQPSAKKTGGRDVLWLGRLSEEKDPAEMIAVAELLAGHPGIGRIRMIGSGPLEDDVRAMKNPGVEITSARASLESAWAEAAVLVNTSKSEGASLTILEALANGVPVVASAVGGTPELLGNAGVLVPRDLAPAERQSLYASAIKRLFDDPERRTTLSLLSRARYEEHFTVEQMIHSLEHLYRNADSPDASAAR